MPSDEMVVGTPVRIVDWRARAYTGVQMTIFNALCVVVVAMPLSELLPHSGVAVAAFALYAYLCWRAFTMAIIDYGDRVVVRNPWSTSAVNWRDVEAIGRAKNRGLAWIVDLDSSPSLELADGKRSVPMRGVVRFGRLLSQGNSAGDERVRAAVQGIARRHGIQATEWLREFRD